MADTENTAVATETEKPFELPAGFSYVRETTKVGEVEYAIEYPQADTLDAWLDYWRGLSLDEKDTAKKYLNEIQSQRASQGGKGPVRDAADEKDESGNVVRSADEVRQEAITKHQNASRVFLLGKPRMRAPGGVTAAKRKELGDAVMARAFEKGAFPTQEEMEEIAKSLGIDPTLLNSPTGAVA